MPKGSSRVQKGAPLSDEELLLRSLNADPMADGKPRPRPEMDWRILLLFVKRFQQLTLAIERVPRKSRNFAALDDPGVQSAFRALNRLFGRYQLTPAILPVSPARNPDFTWKLRWWREGHPQPFAEFSKVLMIERLASEGRLSKLQQCSFCKRWMFTRFSHQRFCSGDCKDSFHRSDPADKQRRREWARENYRIHKTKNVK